MSRYRFGVVALLVLSAGASADVLYVRAGSTGANNGSSWADAFAELRTGLAAAAPGDEVWVAAGTYTPGPPGDIASSFALRSGVALYGGFNGTETSRDQRLPAVHITTLSGDVGRDDVYGSPVWWQGWNINTPNSLHVLTAAGADATAILDGFTITAGRATQTSGGGLQITGGGPTIRGCTFWRDLAGFNQGGGIAIIDASPVIAACMFHQNWVHLGQGGGIYVHGASSPVISGCVFTENRVYGATPEGAGGAISSWSTLHVAVESCLFQGNFAAAFSASGGTSGAYGGAVHNFTGPMSLMGCSFIGNTSNAGGALWTWGPAEVVNCLFRGNQAPEYQASQGGWGGIGGAIGASSFAGATVRLRQCTIVQNTANAGGGLRFLSNADGDINGCILWANSDEHGSVGPSQIRGAGAERCCIQNMLIGIPGEDPPDPENFPWCFASDPGFVALGSDLRLAPGSPCIDSGDNTAFPAGILTDLDGGPRFVDNPAAPNTGVPGGAGGLAIIDLGAYEVRPACYANCDGGTVAPILNVSDFICFMTRYAAGDPYANCDGSTTPPTLNVSDFICFQSRFAAGCP